MSAARGTFPRPSEREPAIEADQHRPVPLSLAASECQCGFLDRLRFSVQLVSVFRGWEWEHGQIVGWSSDVEQVQLPIKAEQVVDDLSQVAGALSIEGAMDVNLAVADELATLINSNRVQGTGALRSVLGWW